MDIRVYVSIEGKHFSPAAFQSKLDPNIRGTIEFRKQVRKGVVERTREHWKSPSVEATDHSEAIMKLHELVSQLRPALLEIRDAENTVTAEVVSHCHEEDEVHGFYLPSDTIELLSDVGASLDFDQYFHMVGGNSRDSFVDSRSS